VATAPSWQDLYDAARAELLARRPELFAEEGDVTDMLLAAAAAGGDYVIGYGAQAFAELFLDTARGAALTALADDRYGLTRLEAAPAVGSVTLSRPTFAAGGGTVPAGSIVATQFDALGQTVEFATTADVTFGASELSKTAAVEAVVPGAAGNVAIGTVTRIVSTLFDPTIVCTNAARLAGGADEETDDALRERVRTFPLTIRRGTLAALEYGALQVAGVVTAKAVEGSTGIVTVYVADGTGNSNAELDGKVAVELENWRAAGCLVQVASSIPLVQNLTFTVKAKSGYDVAANAAVIQAAASARMAKLTMGEILYLDEIKAAVMALDERIQRLTFTTPTADVTPAANEKITAGSITVTAE
jgi:uncharacterized phage protein gp47/JayE